MGYDVYTCFSVYENFCAKGSNMIYVEVIVSVYHSFGREFEI